MTRKAKPPIAVYSALADSTRCRIIELLREGPTPVHRLAEAFSISRPAISRHLRVLKTAGLVAEVKKGRENLYAFRRDRLGKALHWLDAAAASTPPGEVEPGAEAMPGVATPIVVAQPVEPQVIAEKTEIAEKPSRLPRPKKPLEGVNQMGFDF